MSEIEKVPFLFYEISPFGLLSKRPLCTQSAQKDFSTLEKAKRDGEEKELEREVVRKANKKMGRCNQRLR